MRVTSRESQLEVVVGLPCFCLFVTVAGQGRLSRAALAGCSGWDSLFFGIVDAVVTVTDVLVGGQEGRPMLAWVRTAIRKEGLEVA